VKSVVRMDPAAPGPSEKVKPKSHRFQMTKIGGRDFRMPSGAKVHFPLRKNPDGSRQYLAFFETDDAALAAELEAFAKAGPAWGITKL